MIEPLPALLGLQSLAVLELPPVRLDVDARPRRSSWSRAGSGNLHRRVHFIPPWFEELGLVVDDRLRCELVEVIRQVFIAAS